MSHNKEQYETKIIRTVDDLLDYAVLQEVQSLIIEKDNQEFSVKFGINGELQEYFVLSLKVGLSVIEKIKELANITLTRKELLKTGKFKKIYTEFRVVFSVLVKKDGENERILIDIINSKPKLFRLKKLGLIRDTFSKVEGILKKRKGGILILGRFDSGKTTTLYSFLDFVNNHNINIATIEKNILYDIPFVNQSVLNVKKGFNNSFALASVLRQDADVVMIDDIDDKVSAEAFLNIGQRGHLALGAVFSKNILTCLDFFNSLGLSLLLFMDTVNIIITQELVKSNCVHCLVEEKLDEKAKEEIEKVIDIQSFLKKAKEENIIPKSINSLDDVKFYKSKGCNQCDKRKSLNSIGVFEVLKIDNQVKKIIRSGHISTVRKEIKRQDGFFIEEDALLKAINGIIDINQLLRIVRR